MNSAMLSSWKPFKDQRVLINRMNLQSGEIEIVDLCRFGRKGLYITIINQAIKNTNRHAGLDKPAPDSDPGASSRIHYGFRLSLE